MLSYLGELTATERKDWAALTEHFQEPLALQQPQRRLFDLPAKPVPERVTVDVRRVRVEGARDFGEVWPALVLWRKLGLDRLLAELLPAGQEQIDWATIVTLPVVARFCDPSSELQIADIGPTASRCALVWWSGGKVCPWDRKCSPETPTTPRPWVKSWRRWRPNTDVPSASGCLIGASLVSVAVARFFGDAARVGGGWVTSSLLRRWCILLKLGLELGFGRIRAEASRRCQAGVEFSSAFSREVVPCLASTIRLWVKTPSPLAEANPLNPR